MSTNSLIQKNSESPDGSGLTGPVGCNVPAGRFPSRDVFHVEQRVRPVFQPADFQTDHGEAASPSGAASIANDRLLPAIEALLELKELADACTVDVTGVRRLIDRALKGLRQ